MLEPRSFLRRLLAPLGFVMAGLGAAQLALAFARGNVQMGAVIGSLGLFGAGGALIRRGARSDLEFWTFFLAALAGAGAVFFYVRK